MSQEAVRAGAARGPVLDVAWLGSVGYGEALTLQDEALRQRRVGACGDRLLLLEHPAVVTLGRGSHAENVLLGPAELAARGIERFEVARGGDVTYHAPGQLVGYLVVDLEARGRPDVQRFLRGIEGALIAALASLGVPARRVPGRTGVFAGSEGEGGRDRKIASIGIGLRGWLSWHGFALNVGIELDGFDCIVPCGLADVRMTSVAAERAIAGVPVEADLGRRARGCVADAFRGWLDGARA